MIKDIVENNLCTRCGTCISACPVGAIYYEIGENNFNIKVNKKKCINCGLCIKVCPGLEVNFKDLNKNVFGKDKELTYNAYLGYFRNCYLGYSQDKNIRFHCSSGGVITSILIYLLRNKIIDGALVTTMDSKNPLISKPFIAYSEEEVFEARGSKYTPVVLNQCLKEIINSKKNNFAVVGLPCHIHGIRKFQEINPKLKKKIKICLGLICGYGVNFSGSKLLLKLLRTKSSEVKRFYYREEDWPGHITVIKKDDQIVKIPYFSTSKIFTLGFFIPPRCFLCSDFTNELADISFGDAWVPRLMKKGEGFNIIISRSKLGEEVLHQAKEKIWIEKINPNLVIKSKRINLFEKKDSFGLTKIIAKILEGGIPDYKFEPKLKLSFFSPAVFIFYLNSIISERYFNFFLKIPAFIWNLIIKGCNLILSFKTKR